MKIELLRGKVVEKGFTQRSLAESMGLSKNTISAILTGKKSPTLDEVFTLCKVLEINTPEEKVKIFLSKDVPIIGR